MQREIVEVKKRLEISERSALASQRRVAAAAPVYSLAGTDVATELIKHLKGVVHSFHQMVDHLFDPSKQAAIKSEVCN